MVPIFGNFVNIVDIVAILNTFNALSSAFITFYAWNKSELDMLHGNGYICSFLVNILWEKCNSFFSPTAANNGSEITSSLVEV